MTYSQRKAQKARNEAIKCVMAFLAGLIVISLVGTIVGLSANLVVSDVVKFVAVVSGVYSTLAIFVGALILGSK